MKKFILIFIPLLSFIISTSVDAQFQGRYCEMDGAYTESGETVYGEFYMYSERYGEADNVYTESGEYVYGECYRYGLSLIHI